MEAKVIVSRSMQASVDPGRGRTREQVPME